ncbi:hypothetical protein ACQ4PT_009942 [Festuca glaucescens]
MSEGGEEDEPTTTNGGDHTAGDDTTTDGGDLTDGGSGNPVAKKKKERKDRKPTVLTNTTDEITKVSKSGLPLEPADVAAGYGMQLGCIVQESMSINTKHLRSEANERLVDNCLTKLHRRYTFPANYKNMERSNKDEELKAARAEDSSSQGSTEPWDTTFNRATNAYKKRPKAVEVIWAPVLLIHLGGQPWISAYSLEDNELWKRHIVTLVSQVTVALYVFCKWWSDEKTLLAAAILLFVVGILTLA